MTDIPPERQKIFGLVKGKLVDEDIPLGELQIPAASLRAGPHPATGEKRVTISLFGTPIDQTFKDPGARGIEVSLCCKCEGKQVLTAMHLSRTTLPPLDQTTSITAIQDRPRDCACTRKSILAAGLDSNADSFLLLCNY
jgi:hypothetical protein